MLKQLPTRLRLRHLDPLSDLDESVAALKQVAPQHTPPMYMIRDLQHAGTRMGFRQNSRAYLRYMAMKAARTEGDVLECGSGLSTLLLAVTAARRNLQVHTFEHHAPSAQNLRELVERYSLRNVKIHDTPIVSYGDFDWYQFDTAPLSPGFQLVVCDGPARHLTDSGRYGLFPCMRERLNPHAKVIMDDSLHKIDRHVILKWRREHSIQVQNFGRFLQFAEISCV